MKENSELDNFNATLRKVLSVPREELLKREKAWKKEQERKKSTRESTKRGGA
jgi:hypothetical protein